MLSLSINPNSVILNDTALREFYEKLAPAQKKAPIERYMPKVGSCPTIPLPLRFDILYEVNKEVVSMMCLIPKYDNDFTLNAIILGFMEAIYPGKGSPILFNYAQYLSDNIHFQLYNFH